MNFNDLEDKAEDSFISSQPLSAEIALGKMNMLKEPRLINNWVLWLEQRPHENGRTTALIRPWRNSELPPQELTPAPINLRTRVHGYGGAPIAIASQGEKLVISWIDDQDGSLWLRSWAGLDQSDQIIWQPLKPLNDPRCLSKAANVLFADGFIDLLRNLWIGVMESQGRDYLVSFSLNAQDQQPKILYQPKDFIGYATLNPQGDQIAWVEWQKPYMPWDQSELWLSGISHSGDLFEISLISEKSNDLGEPISVFQPVWLPTNELIVAEDSSGWWNLMIAGPIFHSGQIPAWEHLWPMDYEFASPQWVYGMSTIAFSSEVIVCSICKDAKWKICTFTKDGKVNEIDQPFDSLTGLHAADGRVIAIASNSYKESGLLELDLKDLSWIHTPIRKPVIDEQQISVPKPFWFKGFRDLPTHSWFYPPSDKKGSNFPLMVKVHSGPTGMAGCGLNLEIQFWTSRGWGVLDVNYGGSTGFGRKYRDRLKEGWGIVDAYDCAKAALSMIGIGLASKKHIAIEGGSAAGFTVLSCLVLTDVFQVGACRYAVSDLISMMTSTHRFEANYLDYLVGPFPEEIKAYKDRSPQNNIEKINCPIVFFQGLKDNVVLPDQTYNMVDKLKENHNTVSTFTFKNEGHGFRDGNVRIKVIKETEKFFNDQLFT